LINRLEVYDPEKREWLLMVEIKEGQKLTKKGEQLTLDWEHEGKKVKTVYNLNLFQAYCLV
jgi:hypothetical protein